MPEFVRVRNKATGLSYSVKHPDLSKVDLLPDERAVDSNGHVLPPSTQPVDAPKGAGKSKTPNRGDEPADLPKEGDDNDR